MTQYDTSPWPVKDIVYTSIVGSVMLAAFLEWFLWLAAFMYCLFKVFQKAEHWSVRVLAVIVAIIFFLLRAIYLPIMVVTLPLPPGVTQYFPQQMVTILQWFGFWSFAALLTIPWLFCVYQIVTHSLGRTKRIKQVLDEHSAPKVVIVMPCYKEEPDIFGDGYRFHRGLRLPTLLYPRLLSFDGDQEDELYLKTIEALGVPLSLDSYPKSIDVTYRTARITVSRFPHGGKRHCQKATFKLIDKVYTEYLKRNDNLFILFIDSDCILDRVCLQNFMYDMELSPGNTRDMLAMTGVITSTTKKHSLITLLQDMEYIHGQLFERTVESGCGSVTCLPGALTMLRFSAFRRMAKSLIKQRRRWFLGFITNEVCMLTDIRIWKRYPILAVVRFMQNTIRTTALLFFIMVLSIITTTKKVQDLPVGFIGISLGLNWLMMIYFGAKLRRFKIWLYPLMFIINPFFNWYYMVYGIFTCGQRTWGGPRADAGAADSTKTPQQVIEAAEEAGDDLNVIPETFKPAAEARNNQIVRRPTLPLLPPDRLEGRFAAAERLPGGWYQQVNDSLNSVCRWPYVSGVTGTNSVYMPRRVESIMGEEDRKKYEIAQANQKAPAGAYYNQGYVYEIPDGPEPKGGFYDSVESLASLEGTTSNSLAVPQASSQRNGRSPLGRMTLIQSDSRDESIELEDQRSDKRSHSSSPELKPKH
ncbi:hypothetical protein DID88_005796 [Monilinia fructigena]|uniref:chitin synthase n=1 Tax=Monilinia fructigena TaxID=38457 RepID=A0A395J0T0_9HELO|nr:hypothetical protein DID88_005796 [Monilinia fructigena]